MTYDPNSPTVPDQVPRPFALVRTATTPAIIEVDIVVSASTLPDNKPRNRHERRAQAAKDRRRWATTR